MRAIWPHLAAIRPLTAFYRAGFRRYATYRLATAAGAFTNTVFGLLKASILVAAIGGTAASSGGTAAPGGSGGTASVAGYTVLAASTYVWVTQALLTPVNIFSWNELALRVRTGDIAVDLARPADLQLSLLAADLGRATYALLPRALPPLTVGALTFGLALPSTPLPYALGVLSLGLGVSISFACRFAVNLAAFWLIDARGVLGLYIVATNLLCGVLVPVRWFPPWLRTIADSTPFPSMLQAPVDVVTGRVTGTDAVRVLGVQVLWLAATLTLGRITLHRATRRLVVQGG